MILAAGLTPAWQQVMRFDALVPGEVNRAAEVQWCASGKVLNAVRALHLLGAPGKALAPVGGSTGEAVRRDFARLGIAARWVETGAPTRVCTTVVETARHRSTELVENARPLTAGERAAFAAAYAEEAAAAEVVVLIGSLAPGTPAGFYRELLAGTTGKVVLDARGDELLEALHERPFLVKPNRAELARTVGRELRDEGALVDAMRELNRRGAEWVLITDGPNPVHVSGPDGLYRLRPPAAEVVNPIGCGDCMAAGIAAALGRGREPLDACRYGLAAAADKLGRLLPAALDRGRVEALAATLEVTRL
jgi:tagatose 6-phosphate kinase